jgi:hypothetical protein
MTHWLRMEQPPEGFKSTDFLKLEEELCHCHSKVHKVNTRTLRGRAAESEILCTPVKTGCLADMCISCASVGKLWDVSLE